jgi:hypothetical protein
MVLVNAWWEALGFTLAATRSGLIWQTRLDTDDPARPVAELPAGDCLTVGPRSIVVMLGGGQTA